MVKQNTNEETTQGFFRILIGQDVEYLRCLLVNWDRFGTAYV